MGYFLPASPETGAPASSLVSPKTHGPFSRVEERGLRYYSPSLGRWVSRDPIGEGGGLSVYVFVLNRSPYLTDAHGLEVSWSSDSIAGVNSGSIRNRYHEVSDISGEVRDENDKTTDSKHGTGKLNYGYYAHKYHEPWWIVDLPSSRVCNTPSGISVKAKTDCPGKYKVVCRVTYSARVSGEGSAFAVTKVTVAEALQAKYGPEGTYRGDGPVSAEISSSGQQRYSGTMMLTRQYKEVGKIFPNLTFGPEGALEESARIDCFAWSLDEVLAERVIR